MFHQLFQQFSIKNITNVYVPFLYLCVCEKPIIALLGVCHGSARRPYWLSDQSVMALTKVHLDWILPVAAVSTINGLLRDQ